jgi:hypothetical protein
VPWWAAVVVAVTGVAVGFAFDAGSGKELTTFFAALYVAACVAAVLAVRQSGIFTAVIQPPLILFGAVPGAYFLFHGAKFTGIKDLLINCGYPLIERFPLMLFTSAGVLLLGLIRWSLGRFGSAAAEAAEVGDTASEGGRLGLVTRLTGLFSRESADDETVDTAARSRSRRTHAVERSARSTTSEPRRKRPAAPSRTQRVRPAREDAVDPARERAQRRRPARDLDAPEPPRRTRMPRDADPYGRPPREVRRDPHARRERPASRLDPYEPAEPFDAPRPPRRRPAPNGTTATHHPISQVRYRKAAGGDEPLDDRTARPRRPRRPGGDPWD